MARSTRSGKQVRWRKEFGQRIVDGYVWNAANGFVAVVDDAALVERLLGNGDFEVIETAGEAVGTGEGIEASDGAE